jgi:predicted ester cyclase
MSIEHNQTVVRRYYEEVKNQGNLDLLEELIVPDYIEHNPLPGQGQGLAGLRQRAEMLQSAFRARLTVEDMIAEGDKVVVRFANYLVQQGMILGIPATGKSATIQGIAIHRIRGGKIAERWILVDNVSLLQQLGAIPQPSATTA